MKKKLIILFILIIFIFTISRFTPAESFLTRGITPRSTDDISTLVRDTYNLFKSQFDKDQQTPSPTTPWKPCKNCPQPQKPTLPTIETPLKKQISLDQSLRSLELAHNRLIRAINQLLTMPQFTEMQLQTLQQELTSATEQLTQARQTLNDLTPEQAQTIEQHITTAEQTLQDTTAILENLPQYTEILDEAKTNIQTAQNTLDKTEQQLKEFQQQ